MKTACLLVQNVYDYDPRVKRKAQALVAAGYLVDVLALRPPKGKKSYTLDGVNVRTIALGKKRGSLLRYVLEYAAFFLWAFVRTPLQMLRRRYAVIDVNSLPDFLVFAPILAKWMGAKLILDLHEVTPEFYMSKYRVAENSWTVRLMKYLEKISVNFADHVLTINEPIEDLLATRGLQRTKSTVIMNAVDEARFPAASRTFVSPGASDSDRFIMMYHGTLTSIYGLDIAIEAFALCHAQMPGAELWILGNGPEKALLVDLARERGLASKVRLIGHVASNEIPAWLSRCQVGILPIRRDVFLDFAYPNKLPEMIMMGKTVIVSRLRAIQHYFSEHALAYFEPNDPADLAAVMLHMYREPQLRARLAHQARNEHVPICWSVMKQRYLRLVEDLTGAVEPDAPQKSQTTRRSVKSNKPVKTPAHAEQGDLAAVSTTAQKLMAYCRANDFAGHDPYDALNSEVFLKLPVLHSRLPRLVLIQALKRSPIDIRRLLRVPKTQNPKAIALFLSAVLKAPELDAGGAGELAASLAELLVALHSESPYWCWGYSFPWQTRTILVPRGSPNLVCTTFVADALLDFYELHPDSRWLSMVVSAAKYMLNELYWTDGPVASFSYPLASVRSKTHNANLLAAALLCRVYKHTGDRTFLDPALKVARYSGSRQQEDGSWMYGEAATQQWIDNFHTGYNLCALQQIDRCLESNEFELQIQRGLEFYKSHFFREDGAARYFHNSTYPIDIHCVAQSIVTLLAFRDVDPENVRLANSLFQWAHNHMWDPRGFFYYRVLRFGTIRTSYMRWSQAWMLLALATLLESSRQSEDRSPAAIPHNYDPILHQA